MTVRNIFIWITLICINSPVYSQKNIYQTKQFQFKSTDLMYQRLQESLQERLSNLHFTIINNSYSLKYINVYDKVSNDFFTAKPFEKSGNDNMVFNNTGSKILVGVIYGFLIGIGGATIGIIVDFSLCEPDASRIGIDCPFYGTLIGGLIGYHYGVARGVNKIGNINNENGSYAAALIGGIAGHLIGIAALAILPNTATGIFWFISAPVGATIGYNRSRKSKSKVRQGTALINLNGRQIELATPMIYYHRNLSTNRHVLMIDILQIDL